MKESKKDAMTPKENEEKSEEIDKFPQITPAEFELMLERYGITKTNYCQLRGKCRSWFYEVLRQRKFVTVADMKALENEIGERNFSKLLTEVRG